MPSSSIEEENGVCALCDVAGDLVQMKLHGVRVGVWHGNSRTGSASRTDGTKEIGILIALIGRLDRKSVV